MAHVSLAALRALDEVAVKRLWMTTTDAARALGVGRWMVWWLATTGELLGERTVSGQWVFRQGVVRELLAKRVTARLRSRPAVLRAAHLRLVHSVRAPRQQALFTPHGGVTAEAARGAVQGRKVTQRSFGEASALSREIGRGPISGVSLPGEGSGKRMAKVEESHGTRIRGARR